MVWEFKIREGWATVFCLLLILLCVAWSVQAAEWAEGLSILQGVVLGGSVLGIILAKSHAPNRMTHLLSLLAGCTWVLFLVARLLAVSMNLPTEIAVLELDRRIQDFAYVATTQGTSADNLVFVLLLGLLMWLLAYFCAWAVFRWQRTWWAVIASGIALMVNLNYTKVSLTGYLVGFLLFALLLIVRTSLAHYEQEWRKAGVSYSPELIYSFLRAGLIVSVAAILLAWVAPEALASRPLQEAWVKMGEPWRRLQDEYARIFQDLNYQNEPILVTSDRWTRFGGAVELSDMPIMDVQAATGRYWRVMAYHEYTGDGWDNTDGDILIIRAGDPGLAFPALELRREVTQTITLHQDVGPLGPIAAAGQPLRARLPIKAAVSYITLDEEKLGIHDLAADEPSPVPGDASVLYSIPRLEAGESYQVMSSLEKADEESLRQAGTDYPSWVVPRYLQLPNSLPTRVRLLAEEVTTGQETPYDMAKAIEAYLREIPYNLNITGPARGQDGVDYFLFQSKQGYCDYYASAMVVMLRSVGVPARYVRGYSHSTKEDGAYRILERDSHAWPEVFFPGYGWIEFEPTGGEPPLNRPATQPNPAESEANARDRGPDERPLDEMIDTEMNRDIFGSSVTPPPAPWWRRIGGWGWFALTLIALALVAGGLFFVRRRRKARGLSVAEQVYEDLVGWVRRLFRISPSAHQTPYEYAGVVVRAIPQGQGAVQRIAGLYVQERFGHKSVSRAEAEVAWHKAWPALWQRWIEGRVRRVRQLWWKILPPKGPKVKAEK